MTISERIFETMRTKNLKQKDLSEFINIPTATISTWNTRNTSPPAEKIIEIAKFLCVPVEYLLTGNEPNGSGNNGFNQNGDNSIQTIGSGNTITGYGIGTDEHTTRRSPSEKHHAFEDVKEIYEIYEYMAKLSPSERRHASADIMDLLEEKYPKKK